jgi:heterodisulfide reductase subunit D
MDQALYRETLNNCRFCVMCRHVCPVGNATAKEAGAPRGLALNIYAGEQGLMAVGSESHKNLIANCTLCGACYESCITQQNLPQVILAAREKNVAAGGACTEAVVVKNNIQTYGNPFGDNTRFARFNGGHISKTASVVLFPGCTALYKEHGIVASALKILDMAEVNYTMLAGMDCCAAPLKELGFNKEFSAHIEKLKRTIHDTGAKKVVTVCSTCAYWMNASFHELGKADDIEIINFADYFAGLMKGNGKITVKNQREMKIRVQSPCRMARNIGRFDPTVNLLRHIPGMAIDMFNAENLVDKTLRVPESLCCGGCGGTRFVDEATADSVASYQIDHIRQNVVEFDTLITTCSTCKDQLGRAAKGKDIEVMHIVELIASMMQKSSA